MAKVYRLREAVFMLTQLYICTSGPCGCAELLHVARFILTGALHAARSCSRHARNERVTRAYPAHAFCSTRTADAAMCVHV